MTLSLPQDVPPQSRRHSDPPGLWLIVLVGSLGLNGVFIVSFQRYLQHVKPLTTEFAPIAVDFFQADSQPPNNRPQRAAFAPTSNQPIQAASPRPTLTRSSSQTSTAPSSGIAFKPASSPSRSRPIPPAQTPSKSETPLTVDRSNQTDSASPETATNRPSPTTRTTDSPADDKVAASGVLLPGFARPPDPKANPGNSTSAQTETLTLNQNPTPTKFLVQVQVQPQESDRAPSSANPEPIQQTKTFISGQAGCFATPDAMHHFNQPLVVNLTLDQTGTVINAVPATLPASSDGDNKTYQDLVLCSLKTWTFNRAFLAASSTQLDSTKLLVVQVTLQKQ